MCQKRQSLRASPITARRRSPYDTGTTSRDNTDSHFVSGVWVTGRRFRARTVRDGKFVVGDEHITIPE